MTDERLQVIDQVRSLCGPDYAWSGKSVGQLRLDGLKQFLPAEKFEALKGKSDTYVAEFFAVQMDTNPMVQAARLNGRADGLSHVPADRSGGSDLAKELAEERRFNGHQS